VQRRVAAKHPAAWGEHPGTEVQQGGALGVGDVMQQAEQQDRIKLTQLAHVFLGEELAAEVPAPAAAPTGVLYIRITGIEPDIVHVGQAVEVVRRATAHVEYPLPRFQLRLLHKAIPAPVGPDTLLIGDVNPGIFQNTPQ
jgi:hypothetical protein